MLGKKIKPGKIKQQIYCKLVYINPRSCDMLVYRLFISATPRTVPTSKQLFVLSVKSNVSFGMWLISLRQGSMILCIIVEIPWV